MGSEESQIEDVKPADNIMSYEDKKAKEVK